MNSNIKQLIAILLTGFGIIILMLIMENSGMGSIAAIGEENGNSFQVIQTEINKIPNNNWDPIGYSTLTAKIHTSKANGFISGDVEIDLQKKLDLYYINKLVETSERYLHSNVGDYTKIKTNIGQLINSTTILQQDKQKLILLKNTLDAFNYYTVVLPNEASVFINQGVINFNEDKFNSLISKIDNINGSLRSYLNNTKIQNIKQSTKNSLMQFQGEFVSNNIEW
jgi:hypothetical protein